MTKHLPVEPGWVLYKDQLYHVSEFAHLSPRERPQAICPICKQAVILKLGQVRAHHYAHREEVICAANQPETALHLNTKFYLYEELLRAARLKYPRLYIDQKCSGLGCPTINRIVWSQGWNDVRVEHRMNPLRPDIVLMHEGKVVAAIEVLVTHAVDQSKAALFQKQNLPWLEVPADESLYEADGKWTIAQPLPFTQSGPLLPVWNCSSCLQFQEGQAQRKEELAREEEERARRQEDQRLREAKLQQQRELEYKRREEELRKQEIENSRQIEWHKKNREEVYCARVVDYYFPRGGRQREIFFVIRVFKNGQEVGALLKTQGTKIIQSSDRSLTEASLQQFRQAAEQEIQRLEGEGIKVDSSAPWRRETKAWQADLTNRPFSL